jgi:ADP-ribosylglycohydrolase
MYLDLDAYREKLKGCWAGKNIGGVLGAPFEGYRQVNDVDYYTQPDIDQNPPPNDDLDLQLIWLIAAEKHGPGVNARSLAEYWISYVIPDWSEYGAAKANLRAGLVPPLSGYVRNPYRNSCGCFIRSEIWACLCPGHPELAVRYAYEDAIVDHSHEGVYAEVFCAAMQSAAFVTGEPAELIRIGLSYIPEDSGVAQAVRSVLTAREESMTWQEARTKVLTDVPGSFGLLGTPKEAVTDDIPAGEIGWDAPSNIGIMLIGWLYGEGDFGRGLCTAVDCGEDTDCTAATLGSLLGIINGYSGIPERWTTPIGDTINTFCVNLTNWEVRIPHSVPELVDRIVRLTPRFLGSAHCDCVESERGYRVLMNEPENLEHRENRKSNWVSESFCEKLSRGTYTTEYDFGILKAAFDYGDEPFVEPGVPRTVSLTLENGVPQHQWVNVKWLAPEGVSVSAPTKRVFVDFHRVAVARVEFTVTVDAENRADRYELAVELSSDGRPTRGFIPVTLFRSQA